MDFRQKTSWKAEKLQNEGWSLKDEGCGDVEKLILKGCGVLLNTILSKL